MNPYLWWKTYTPYAWRWWTPFNVIEPRTMHHSPRRYVVSHAFSVPIILSLAYIYFALTSKRLFAAHRVHKGDQVTSWHNSSITSRVTPCNSIRFVTLSGSYCEQPLQQCNASWLLWNYIDFPVTFSGYKFCIISVSVYLPVHWRLLESVPVFNFCAGIGALSLQIYQAVKFS